MTSLNASSNNIAAESGYIKKTECTGSDFSVGSLIRYMNEECVVSKAVDTDGELKVRFLSGVKALADGLSTNITIKSLDISSNYLGPAGAKFIADTIPQCR